MICLEVVHYGGRIKCTVPLYHFKIKICICLSDCIRKMDFFYKENYAIGITGEIVVFSSM